MLQLKRIKDFNDILFFVVSINNKQQQKIVIDFRDNLFILRTFLICRRILFSGKKL